MENRLDSVDKLDLGSLLVKVKVILKGKGQAITIHCTAEDACLFVDWLNRNRFETLSKADKEKMDNRYYVFDDHMKKETVMIERDSVRYMSIPFYMGDEEGKPQWRLMEWG